MKKILFLLPLFLIVFMPKNTFAMSYIGSDGDEHNVTDERSLLDFCYFHFNNDDNKIKTIALSKDNYGQYYCAYNSSSNTKFYKQNSYVFNTSVNVEAHQFNDFNTFSEGNHYSLNNCFNGNEIIYTTADIYDDFLYSNIVIKANITIDDIINSYEKKPIYKITYYVNNEVYKTIEVEKGSSITLENYTSYNKATHTFSGWKYEDSVDLNNITSDVEIKATLIEKDVIPVYIDFPISKNEFYVLLFEVAVLIIMLFLKWCFPSRGGKSI